MFIKGAGFYQSLFYVIQYINFVSRSGFFILPVIRTLQTLSSFSLLAGNFGLDKEVGRVVLLDDVIGGGVCCSSDSLVVGAWSSKSRFSGLCLSPVLAIIQNGVGGIVFQGEIPPELEEAANTFSTPLFFIPQNHALLNVLFALETEFRKAGSTLRSSFSPFADILLNDGDFERILWALREQIHCGVAYKDLIHKQLFVASFSDEFKEHVKIYPLKEIIRLHQHMEVRVGGVLSGYLILNRSSRSDRKISFLEMSALENAVIAVKLSIEKQLSAQRVERNYIDEFVRDLIYNKIQRKEELESRARTFSWNPVNGVVVVVVEVEALDGEAGEREFQVFFSTIRSKFQAFFPKSIYTMLTKSVVFLISPPDPDNEEKTLQTNIIKVAEHLNEEAAKELHCEITVAVGGYKTDPLSIHDSYREAVRALRVSRLATFPQEVVFWENLGGMKLLSMVSQSQEAETFCQSILKDLIEYDKSTNGELLQTLRVLNKNNWNVKHASEVMKFHYNTIKYRNKKICDLLNFNPDNSDQRFDIALALKLYDLGSFSE